MDRKEENRKLNLLLGARVQQLRQQLGYSRKELAERLEISEFFLVEIELGRRGVSNVTLCRLAQALCTTTDYLLTGREEFSDVSSVTAMLATLDPPLVKGAEHLLRAYLTAVGYAQSTG